MLGLWFVRKNLMTPNGPWRHFPAASVLALLTPGAPSARAEYPGYARLLPPV